MSKLISAEEAAALSNFDVNIDRHIDRINREIKRACQRHDNRVRCLLDPCSDKEAVKIAAQLRAAGYWHRWESLIDGGRIVRFTIVWEVNKND